MAAEIQHGRRVAPGLRTLLSAVQLRQAALVGIG
jgi:hypothetical protein